jgi:hypothetical protein
MTRVPIRLDEAAHLPPVCVCCGQPATRMRRQEFQLNATLSAAVLVTSVMLDALVWTKRGVTLALPVCEYHRRRGRRSNRTFFQGMSLTVALGVAAYLVSLSGHAAASYLGVAAMFAFVVSLVVGMHQVDDGLAVKSLQGDSFILAGVDPKFAEAVKCSEQRRPTRVS